MNAQSYAELLALAKTKAGEDVTLVLGRGDTLLLDIDSAYDLLDAALTKYSEFPGGLRRLSMFPEIAKDPALKITMWPSRNGNIHVEIYTPRHFFSLPDRVALQSIFGSDAKREALALRDYYAGGQFTVALFRPATSQPVDITKAVLDALKDEATQYPVVFQSL